MRREVSTGVAILLGFAGFLAGFFGFIGLARLELQAFIAMGVPLLVTIGLWLGGRRDAAVGMLLGLVAIVVLVVSAVRAWTG